MFNLSLKSIANMYNHINDDNYFRMETIYMITISSGQVDRELTHTWIYVCISVMTHRCLSP